MHVGVDSKALLFPARGGGHMAPSSLYLAVKGVVSGARGCRAARFALVDLRHTGATLAAATGATLGDPMARMGHSTPAVALIYQHAVSDRDQAIARALSSFAGANSIPLAVATAALT